MTGKQQCKGEGKPFFNAFEAFSWADDVSCYFVKVRVRNLETVGRRKIKFSFSSKVYLRSSKHISFCPAVCVPVEKLSLQPNPTCIYHILQSNIVNTGYSFMVRIILSSRRHSIPSCDTSSLKRTATVHSL